jgi:hypothetical protein
MAANKVRVSKLLGASAGMGLMDPKVGMVTDHGPILTLASGNHTVTVGLGTGDKPGAFYPWQLTVTHAHATGVHAFPTGDGSVLFGHDGIWPNGVPDVPGTGMVVFTGSEMKLFSRP